MLKHIRLLLIEDDPDDAFVMGKLLKSVNSVNFNITFAESLNKSLNYIGKKFFDIILLDLMLPNGKGIDVFNAIHNKCEEIPIVIVSGWEDHAIDAVKAGAQDYLIKPVKIEQIITSINYAIERKKIEEECKKEYKNLLINIDERKNKERKISNILELKLDEWNKKIKETKIHYQEQIQRLEKASLNIINGKY